MAAKPAKKPKKPAKRSGKKRGLFSRILRICLIIFLSGFLLSIVYALFCKWVNPPVTITQAKSFITGHGLKRDYIPMSKISKDMKLAVIASEDQLFPDHNGFDFKSIEKAMKHNQKSKSMRGASTISQQVAKNVFLWQHGGFFRKGLEVYFTFLIETMWSKERILEVYLNVAEMGDGIFGVEAAARKYFNKKAVNLTRTESAMIAATLPNPRTHTINPMSGFVAKRYPWIVNQMHNLEGDPDIQELIK
jgi:monofunctional glycosyltransferase